MSKSQADRPAPSPTASPPGRVPDPTLGVAVGASVRRHLGQGLRGLYADTLAAPMSQRLEALIAQLDKPKGRSEA